MMLSKSGVKPMYWLPIFLVIFFGIIMAEVGKRGIAGGSLIIVLFHTIIVRLAFWDHSLLWMILFLTVQLWALFIVTFFQRNRWRRFEKIGSD